MPPKEFLILVFICIGLVIVKFIYHKVKTPNDNISPQISREVQVIKKHQDGMFARMGGTYGLYVLKKDRKKYITFKNIKNDVKTELVVPTNDYAKIQKGQIGILITQGSRYVKFECISHKEITP